MLNMIPELQQSSFPQRRLNEHRRGDFWRWYDHEGTNDAIAATEPSLLPLPPESVISYEDFILVMAEAETEAAEIPSDPYGAMADVRVTNETEQYAFEFLALEKPHDAGELMDEEV